MNPEPRSIGTIPSIGTNPWSYRWISAYRIGKLHMESRHQCWKIYAGFRSIQSSIQTSLSGKVLHILKRQIASIIIENLHSRRVWVLKRWLLSSYNPTSDKNQKTFLSRKFWKVFSFFRHFHWLVLKEDGRLHGGKHSLVKLFFIFLPLFKNLICFLGSI